MPGSSLTNWGAAVGWVMISGACARGVDVEPRAEALVAGDSGVFGDSAHGSAVRADGSDRGTVTSGEASLPVVEGHPDGGQGEGGGAPTDASTQEAAGPDGPGSKGDAAADHAPVDHASTAEDARTADATAEEASPPRLLFDPQVLYGIHPLAAPTTISIAVDGNAQTDGARVKQWDASASDESEKFRVFDAGGGSWRICVKASSDQCLTNPRGQTVDTTPLQMSHYTANDPWQRWLITADPANNDTFVLKNVASALCADEAYRQTTADLTLQVYACNATIAQEWLITQNP